MTVVATTIAFAAVPSGHPVADDPVTVAPPPPTDPPTPTPTPTPTPEPDPGVPPIVPPRTTQPVPPVIPPPVVVAPAPPAAPTIDHDPVSGRIGASGAGDVPGATIELWGTTTSLVTGTTSPATLLASTIVAPDGTWTTPEAAGLTPINVTVWVTQVRGGLSSDPVELFADAVFNAAAVSTAGTVAGGVATWQLIGWAGATWEIREPGGGATVASGVIAPDGTAVASVTLPAAASGTVLDYDYGYVQDGAMAVSAPGLTAVAP